MDAYELAQKFKYFRTTDVVDGLDAVGRADLTLMDERIKPLWQGIRFWGPAVTVRALPANTRMPVLSPEEAIRSHQLRFDEFGGMDVRHAARRDGRRGGNRGVPGPPVAARQDRSVAPTFAHVAT